MTKVISEPGVSAKSISEVVSIKQLREEYGLIIETGGRVPGKGLTGKIIFEDENSKGGVIAYPFVIAAPQWLRDVTKDVDGNVISVKPREQEDENFTLTDFHILTMPVVEDGHENISDRDIGIAYRQLSEVKSTTHQSAGTEIEGELALMNNYLFSDNKEKINEKINKLFAKYRQELCFTQFEDNTDIRGATPDQLRSVMQEAVSNLITEAAEEGLLIPFLSTTPLAHDLNAFNSLGHTESQANGPYVQNVAKGLFTYFVEPFFNNEVAGMNPAVRDAWSMIQKVQQDAWGNTYREHILMSYNDIRYWFMNSYHTSFDLSVDDEGKPSEHVIKGFSNLSFSFRSLLIGLNFSGGHAFGADILLEDGTLVQDARHLLNLTIPSSYPPNAITAEEDILQRTIDATVSGGVNSADRGAYICTVNGVEYSNLHGDARLRQLIELAKIIKEKNDPKNRGKSYRETIRDLSKKSTRVESTVRSATPDFRKYESSVAFQLVLKSAASLAVIDGYSDIYDWINEKVYQGKYNRVTSLLRESTNTKDLTKELWNLQRGNFPADKLKIYRDIYEYIKRGDHLNDSIIQAVERGFDAIETFGCFSRGEIEGSAVEKLQYYSKGDVSNWGDFSNSLSDIEIRTILESYQFIDRDEKEYSRGQLLMYLGEMWSMMQVLGYEYYDTIKSARENALK